MVEPTATYTQFVNATVAELTQSLDDCEPGTKRAKLALKGISDADRATPGKHVLETRFALGKNDAVRTRALVGCPSVFNPALLRCGRPTCRRDSRRCTRPLERTQTGPTPLAWRRLVCTRPTPSTACERACFAPPSETQSKRRTKLRRG